MTTQVAGSSVSRSIAVDVPIEHAFAVFTEGIGTWWPESHHILDGELKAMVFEPRAGGHIRDVATDGSECRWSRVLEYEPPTRVLFSWDISLRWQIETDPSRCSEVEVRFSPDGEHRTLVELEHRHIDRHGEGWQQMRDAVGSPGGWSLESFAAAAQASA
jgi:uncharacterized protein YndB with AHSA1/START domain